MKIGWIVFELKLGRKWKLCCDSAEMGRFSFIWHTGVLKRIGISQFWFQQLNWQSFLYSLWKFGEIRISHPGVLGSAGPSPAAPTGPTSRRARVSEPTRATRLTNPRLLAKYPSHRHKRLLIYRRCHYFFIFRLLIFVLVIYSLLKMATEKGACRKWKWSKTGHLYASVATVIFWLNGLARRTSFIQKAKLLDF